MHNRIGQPVTGDDFYDRETEQARLWRYLESDNLLLLAPRRVGKTSLMRRLVESSSNQGFHAFYLTVEGAESEDEFVKRLFQAVADLERSISEPVLDPLEKSPLFPFLKRVRKVGGLGFSLELSDQSGQSWSELALALGKSLSQVEGRWLLAIDELPVFILKLLKSEGGVARAGQFLHRLRELRQNLPHTRWLLAGSIGLDTVAGRENLGDTINDLRSVGLGAFDTDTASAFLLELGKSYRITLSPQIRDHIIERIAWPIPYYLQLIFSQLCEDANGHDSPDRAMVDATFEHLLDPAHKGYFDYWRQRLHEELGSPDDRRAILLLNQICRAPQGISRTLLNQALADQITDPDERAEHLRYLLDVLLNDGYLIEEPDGAEGRYLFRMPLLREFWLRRVAQ